MYFFVTKLLSIYNPIHTKKKKEKKKKKPVVYKIECFP